jgi:hypothetical protein
MKKTERKNVNTRAMREREAKLARIWSHIDELQATTIALKHVFDKSHTLVAMSRGCAFTDAESSIPAGICLATIFDLFYDQCSVGRKLTEILDERITAVRELLEKGVR